MKPRKNVKQKKMRFDSYLDGITMREKPISDASLELMGRQFLEYALNDETALLVKPFFTERGITSNDTTRWRKRNKKFAKAYQLAKCAIGSRREIGALLKKYDSSMVLRSMAHYHDTWKELEVWRSELRNKEEEKKIQTFVVRAQDFSKKRGKVNAQKEEDGD